MPKVSVIINCYNGEKYLNETLQSIKSQTFKDFEVIFLDNCSDDKSAEIALSFGNQLHYYKTDTNIPLGEARNLAMSYSKGDYCCFIDCDDLWEESKLEKQVAFLENNTACSLVTSNHYILNMIDGSKTIFFKSKNSAYIDFIDFACGYQYSLSSFMFRRKTVIEYDCKFDNKLSYAEEYDFFLKIAYYAKIYYMDEVLCTYRVHEAMNSRLLKDTIPDEYNVVIKNLSEMIPDFTTRYHHLLDYLYFQRDYTLTKLNIEKGNNKEARRNIKPYKSKNKKAKLFYILTFFPACISRMVFNRHYKKNTY